MSKSLWKAVEKGDIVTRQNTERKFGSAATYEFQWARWRGKMRLFAFTEDVLNDAEQRAISNVEDMPMLKPKRWFNW